MASSFSPFSRKVHSVGKIINKKDIFSPFLRCYAISGSYWKAKDCVPFISVKHAPDLKLREEIINPSTTIAAVKSSKKKKNTPQLTPSEALFALLPDLSELSSQHRMSTPWDATAQVERIAHQIVVERGKNPWCWKKKRILKASKDSKEVAGYKRLLNRENASVAASNVSELVDGLLDVLAMEKGIAESRKKTKGPPKTSSPSTAQHERQPPESSPEQQHHLSQNVTAVRNKESIVDLVSLQVARMCGFSQHPFKLSVGSGKLQFAGFDMYSIPDLFVMVKNNLPRNDTSASTNTAKKKKKKGDGRKQAKKDKIEDDAVEQYTSLVNYRTALVFENKVSGQMSDWKTKVSPFSSSSGNTSSNSFLNHLGQVVAHLLMLHYERMTTAAAAANGSKNNHGNDAWPASPVTTYCVLLEGTRACVFGLEATMGQIQSLCVDREWASRTSGTAEEEDSGQLLPKLTLLTPLEAHEILFKSFAEAVASGKRFVLTKDVDYSDGARSKGAAVNTNSCRNKKWRASKGEEKEGDRLDTASDRSPDHQRFGFDLCNVEERREFLKLISLLRTKMSSQI